MPWMVFLKSASTIDFGAVAFKVNIQHYKHCPGPTHNQPVMGTDSCLGPKALCELVTVSPLRGTGFSTQDVMNLSNCFLKPTPRSSCWKRGSPTAVPCSSCGPLLYSVPFFIPTPLPRDSLKLLPQAFPSFMQMSPSVCQCHCLQMACSLSMLSFEIFCHKSLYIIISVGI